MPPLHHRAPGLAGAILQTDEVAAEIICDGVHVHPALVRHGDRRETAVARDGDHRRTAAAGLPVGGRASLGGQHDHRRRIDGASSTTAPSPAA